MTGSSTSSSLSLVRTLLVALASSTVALAAGCSGSSSGERTSSSALADSVDGSGSLVGLGGHCLDVFGGATNDGATVGIWDCHDAAWQDWSFADGVLHGVGGKCLDVSGAGTANGTRVQLWTCNGTVAQVWQFENGELVNPHSGKCLDVVNVDDSDGATVQIWDCWNGPNQQWALTGGVSAPAPVPVADAGSPPPVTTPPVAAPRLSAFVGGTNLSGAEFGSAIPGVAGTDYVFPTHAEVDYFVGKGMRLIRIPFLWERLQTSLGAPFDAGYFAGLDDLASYITSKGAYALLDPHDYARYRGAVIGSSDPGAPTTQQFGQFWATLAGSFAANPMVIFGLMNEPNSMATEQWLTDANAAIAAIRAAGATNVITVPGNGWTGAHWWTSGGYGTPDGTVMLGIVDPLDNYVYEVHQYLDADFSGTSSECVSSTIGSQEIESFTAWLHANGKRAILGEFAGADNPTCLAAVDDLLRTIDANRDVWAGWTWWSAGPWWWGYMFSLEPNGSADAPQMATLLPHL